MRCRNPRESPKNACRCLNTHLPSLQAQPSARTLPRRSLLRRSPARTVRNHSSHLPHLTHSNGSHAHNPLPGPHHKRLNFRQLHSPLSCHIPGMRHCNSCTVAPATGSRSGKSQSPFTAAPRPPTQAPARPGPAALRTPPHVPSALGPGPGHPHSSAGTCSTPRPPPGHQTA